jgi:hypothetical protein
MAEMALEEVAAAVQALPWEEQRQLWEMLNALRVQREEQAKHQQVLQRMLEDGVITRIPPPMTDFTRHRNWKPIEVEGKPVSETIIEERR